MRHWQLSLTFAAIVFTHASSARADACLDASERARTELQARHLLSARAQLRTCASSSCEDAIRTVCEERLTEIAQRLASIVFDVKDGDGHDLTSAALTVDGVPTAEPAGAEITLDPGPHTFSFEWNAQTETRTFVLLEREKGRREAIAFPRVSAPAPTPEPPPQRPIERSPGTWRTVGAFTLAAGAIGLGIGTAFGIVAIGKNADADCDASNVCADPRSRHDARIAANVSTGAFITGGVLAAAGLVLFFVGAKR